MNQKQLLVWNKKGIFPGPKEGKKEFLDRAHFFLSNPSAVQKNTALKSQQDFCEEKLKKLFDISVNWLGIEEKLCSCFPWQLAISEFYEKKPYVKISIKKKQYFETYSLEEKITHEIAHACRMSFDDDEFEEILAYQTSPQTFRRLLGPIAESSMPLYLLFSLLSLLVDCINIFFDFSLWISLILKSLAVLFFFIDLLCLCEKQRTFHQCLKNLEKIKKDKGLAIAYRLSDQEIRLFSKKTVDQIRWFAEEEKKHSFRWEILYQCYFKKLAT